MFHSCFPPISSPDNTTQNTLIPPLSPLPYAILYNKGRYPLSLSYPPLYPPLYPLLYPPLYPYNPYPLYTPPDVVGNTLGAVAGTLGPIVLGLFVDTSVHPITGWRITFLLTAAMSAVALVLWSIYHTADVIPVLNEPAVKRK